ncbi:SNF2 helicase associated domain-containing protein [Bacillus sp. 31A1R]|uniref:SNF2 helicase associated domain-containing protein n=1 Tax=Robertmurraya mangrovi TaxID=3098077 RepID=A0ABU5IWH1_9BACI|nr:SNF2 helicase associated domain-containing protein [Bacillus sp. 31A1R]MDZ5471475.1 SNF2 helicase associated domain-containing protein [Bacillus sp. 31A1R]
MNIKLNQKIIQDLCGTVSFKRGDAFYRANKVIIEQYDSNLCEAVVEGTEDFRVFIKIDKNGGFQSECSCPTLASFDKECQHVAAVLLTILDIQRKGTPPTKQDSSVVKVDHELTAGLFSLFHKKPTRSSGHQLHFENREVMKAKFICSPLKINEEFVFALEIKLQNETISDMHAFLDHVKNRKPYRISESTTYDSNFHCFSTETDKVIEKLTDVLHDSKTVNRALLGQEKIVIPPTVWDQLVHLLEKAPFVELKYNDRTYKDFKLVETVLPLQFDLSEREQNRYQLKIQGLEQIIIMNSYQTVLAQGKVFQLKKDDCNRLYELNAIIEASDTKHIPVLEDQLHFFIDKVVPGLKKLGLVNISRTITEHLIRIPLVAKIYLDRIKNRLLAGLEFHYDHLVINPLESQQSAPIVVRDVKKEEQILSIMEDSLFAKTDGGYFLQNEELEYDFLYHQLPKLQKLSQIYATTAVRNRLFRESARPRISIKAPTERTNWLEFKFEMDGIPDKQIKDILQALEEKRKYYRLRNGSLLSLESKEFDEIKRFISVIPEEIEKLEEGLNIPLIRGLSIINSEESQEAYIYEESFRNFLETIYNPNKMEIDLPSNLESTLRDYQKYGYRWMKTLAHYGFGGILADDMGLGKTLQSISFIQSNLEEIRKNELPVLIVCPTSLTYNWVSEFMKFTPEIQAVVMDGTQDDRQRIQEELSGVDVIIISYPLLRKDSQWFEKKSFHTVFYDEAQAFKNPYTQTARAVKKIKAGHRFALTGTPVENSLEELWSIFHVVFPELFLGLKDFSNLTRKSISRRIRPFLLRRLKEDVIGELPDKVESLETVELLPDQKKLYAAYLAKLRHDTLKHLDKDTLRKNKIKILAGLTRLRQICCHPGLFVDGYKGSSAKFDQLLKILEESKLSGRRILIFSQFTKMLGFIGRELASQGEKFFYLDGHTPSEERVELCNRFNNGENDIFLISLKAGGTGLNLTGADTVILYDLWWNPAVEEQAADRAHRIGQENTVQVIKLVSKGTIEEKMNELQDKKRHLVEEILEPGEKANVTLTEDDIREILMI